VTPLINVLWRLRMAALLCRRDALTFGDAWTEAGQAWWLDYRRARYTPREALLEDRGHAA